METVATAHGITPTTTGDRRRQAIRGIGSRARAADGCRPAERRVRASGKDVLCPHDEGTPSNPSTGGTPRRAPGPARRAPSWTADGPRSRHPTFGAGEAT